MNARSGVEISLPSLFDLVLSVVNVLTPVPTYRKANYGWTSDDNR